LAGFTETDKVAGVVVAVGDTESHPLLEAVAVKVVAAPPEVIERICAGGTGPLPL
jgi:hypothetical protein